MSDPDPPKDAPGAEVFSIEDARKKSEERAAQATGSPPPPTPPVGEVTPGGAVANFMGPIVAAIAKELSGLADAKGNIDIGAGGDEAARIKTEALLKGLGQGLGAALAQAFSKWSDKVDVNFKFTPDAAPTPTAGKPATPPAESAPAAPAPGTDKPDEPKG